MGQLNLWLLGLQHEWRQLVRSRVLWGWCVLIWVLSFWVLQAQYQEIQRYQGTRSATLSAQQHMWEHQGELNAHTAAHHGLYAFKPWQGLSLLEPGLQPVLGSQVFLEAHKQNTAEGRPSAQNPALSRLAPLSLASVFQILVPLALLVLGYGQLSHEREQGTLKMVSLYAGQLNRWGWNKYFALNLALLLLVTPAVLLSLVLQGQLASPRWDQTAVFLLSYVVYWQVFIFLTLILSGLTGSKQAFIGVLAFWSLNTLVVPRTLMSGQNLRTPLPTRGTFEAQIEADVSRLPSWYEREAALKISLKNSGVQKNLEGMILLESEAEETAVYQKRYRELYDRYARDLNTYQSWGWAFPLLHVQGLSQALAGSDFFHHYRFLQASEAYRQAFVKQLNRSIADHPEREAFSYKANQELWQALPPFTSDPLTLTEVLETQRQPLMALGFWCLLGALGYGFTLRKMRVLA